MGQVAFGMPARPFINFALVVVRENANPAKAIRVVAFYEVGRGTAAAMDVQFIAHIGSHPTSTFYAETGRRRVQYANTII